MSAMGKQSEPSHAVEQAFEFAIRHRRLAGCRSLHTSSYDSQGVAIKNILLSGCFCYSKERGEGEREREREREREKGELQNVYFVCGGNDDDDEPL